ncbi:autotransporter protein [Helicobacter pametensis]|nr:autotransporter protein [Helicobacter pametensis]
MTPTYTPQGKIDTPAALNAQKRSFYKTLTIGNLNKATSQGLVGNNLVFRLYADAHGGDKITINKANTLEGNQTHYFQVNFASSDLATLRDFGFKKDIVLVEVKDELKNSVTFKGLNAKSNNNASAIQGEKQTLSIARGFSDFQVSIQNREQAGYYQYYIMSGEKLLSNGITGTYAQTGTQANINTYQIFTANLNSLNKRMGELRDSDGNEGLWTRVYNGQQYSEFGTGVTTNYTTIQLGYDGHLSLKDSELFAGGAFSYSYGASEFNNVRPWESGTASVLNRSDLNSLDLAAYVSYIMDNGFYSDSIVKATHIMNNLSTTGSERYNTNTQGVSISQEIGYRARLPLGLFLDPQAEVSYAYLGEQDFTQNWTDPNDATTSASLRFHQAGIHTLRSRAGLNFGMDFKEFFDKDSKSNATLYFGAYYVYDYIHGGNITMDNLDPKMRTTLSSNPYSSTGRAVLNLGTNVTFSEGTKLYIDLERSFGGKITTEYQVNLGVRVGFGEKTDKRIIQTKPFKQPKWTMTPKSEEEKKKPVNWKAPTKEELEARKAKKAKRLKNKRKPKLK